MFVDQRGSNETITRAEVEYALDWYLKRLLGPWLAARCYVRLIHREFDAKNDKATAKAYFINNKDPRRFLIELSTKLKKAPVLRALAHEAVHVKQFAQGQLWDAKGSEGLVCWKKRTVREKDYNYRQRPWEKEAYRVERLLYAAYKRHKEKEKIIF